jgi:hypothetical protein
MLISPSLYKRAKYRYPNQKTGPEELSLASILDFLGRRCGSNRENEEVASTFSLPAIKRLIRKSHPDLVNGVTAAPDHTVPYATDLSGHANLPQRKGPTSTACCGE